MAAARDDFVRMLRRGRRFCLGHHDAALHEAVGADLHARQMVCPATAELVSAYRRLDRHARIERIRDCHYPSLEKCLPMLSPRPLLMIHGGADNYIKPDMARALFEMAGDPKEFWLVDKAKHNQAFILAQDEYKARVLAFFERHIAEASPHQSNGKLV